MERQAWSRRVGQVFNTMPRDGSDEKTVWLRREDIELRFVDVLNFPGVHICLDGPTGTGKTSLALTGLNKSKSKYVLVQVTKNMNWLEFCKRLVTEPSTHESSLSAELEGGVVGVLPQGKFRISLSSNKCSTDSIGLLDKIAEGWTEHDVCEMLIKNKTALFIDDFEKANNEIIERVADMCKLLTESYVERLTKIIIVGTDDIYKRLYQISPSLEARLEEISLGTLPRQTDSWKFLQLGFEALKLTHPADDPHVPENENIECMRAVYEAANGLPKSLNELGRDISMKGYDRNRVSPHDVKTVAKQMPERHIKLFRREFPKIINIVERNAVTREVLCHLYREGIGKIHNWDEIISSLCSEYQEDQLDNAINELVEVRFLVQTGKNGDVVFVKDPRLAHTLGVIVENPAKYGQRPEKYALMGQLTLPFRRNNKENSI